MLEFDLRLPDQSNSFFIGRKDSGLYADVIVESTDAGFMAQTYLDAPGRGDEILILVGDKLQELADETGREVVHIATPENKGARRLYKRTAGYVKTNRKDSHGNPVYEKSFSPSHKPRAYNVTKTWDL